MILVVDVKGMAYRGAWLGGRVRAADGFDATGLYGFVRVLLGALNNFTHVNKVLLCCDPVTNRGNLWRHDIYPDYKGTRRNVNPKEEELRDVVNANLPLIAEMASHLNVTWLEDPDEEADDLISWAAGNYHTDTTRLILSNDKDLFQLVQWPNVEVAYTHKSKYVVLGAQSFDLAILDVIQAEGSGKWAPTTPLPPKYWLALKCLRGDKSDNIPGITRVGPKTAYEVVTQSMRETTSTHPWDLLAIWVRKQLARPKGPGALASTIFDNQAEISELLQRNYQLMYLDPARPLQARSGWQGTLNTAAIDAMFTRYNFRSLLPEGKYRASFEQQLLGLQ